MLVSLKPQIDALSHSPPTMAEEVVVVTTTLPGGMSEEEVGVFVEPLVNGRLVACAHRSRIHSTYLWKGEKCAEEEWKLEFKTSVSRLGELLSAISESHPYEEPQIIHRIHQASEGYAGWVVGNTEE
jgi:periplasmic divalent cation tolerance protein